MKHKFLFLNWTECVMQIVQVFIVLVIDFSVFFCVPEPDEAEKSKIQ